MIRAVARVRCRNVRTGITGQHSRCRSINLDSHLNRVGTIRVKYPARSGNGAVCGGHRIDHESRGAGEGCHCATSQKNVGPGTTIDAVNTDFLGSRNRDRDCDVVPVQCPNTAIGRVDVRAADIRLVRSTHTIHIDVDVDR